METIGNVLSAKGHQALSLCLFLSLSCTAGAQDAFRVSAKMKEAEIIKKGMTEASDSAARVQYARWYEETNPVWEVADSASVAEATAWFDNNCDERKITAYSQRTRVAKEKYEEVLDRYVRSHPGEYPAAAIIARWLLYDFKFTADDYDDFSAMVADNPDTVHVDFIKSHIDKARKYALGNPYVDLEGMRPDNTTARLSELMQPGKWTLIDFWASWCGPCCEAIPEIKELLGQHGGKLQAVSVSMDEKEANWREAEKKAAMPWPQLWLKKTRAAVDAYAVRTIPRLVLVDPEGRIRLVTNKVSLIREKMEAL